MTQRTENLLQAKEDFLLLLTCKNRQKCSKHHQKGHLEHFLTAHPPKGKIQKYKIHLLIIFIFILSTRF